MAAKQGRIRNLGNTITRNKAVVVGEAGEELLQASPITISQQRDQLVYQVNYKEHKVTKARLVRSCQYTPPLSLSPPTSNKQSSKHGTVQEVHSTFGYFKSLIIIICLVWFVSLYVDI